MSRTVEFFFPNSSNSNKFLKANTIQESYQINKNCVFDSSSEGYLYSQDMLNRNMDGSLNIHQENHFQKLSDHASLVSSYKRSHTRRNHKKYKSVEGKKLLVTTSAYKHPVQKERQLVEATSAPVLSQKRYFLRGSSNQPIIEFNHAHPNLASGEHKQTSKKNLQKTNSSNTNSIYPESFEIKNSSLINVDLLVVSFCNIKTLFLNICFKFLFLLFF